MSYVEGERREEDRPSDWLRAQKEDQSIRLSNGNEQVYRKEKRQCCAAAAL